MAALAAPQPRHAPVVRDERGRIVSGANNLKGRPKTGLAFAEAVREHIEPLELIRLALEIARGKPAIRDLAHLRMRAEAEARGEPPPPIEGVEVAWPTNAERLSAIAFLHGAGWQKPPQGIELGRTDAPMLDYSKLSPVELDALEQSLAKAAGIIDVAAERQNLEPAPARAPELEAPRQDAPAAGGLPNPDPLGILR